MDTNESLPVRLAIIARLQMMSTAAQGATLIKERKTQFTKDNYGFSKRDPSTRLFFFGFDIARRLV